MHSHFPSVTAKCQLPQHDFSCNKSNPRLHTSHCSTATTAMDDPRSFFETIDPVIGLMLDHMLYCSFIERGLYQTAEVFRQETGAHFPPISPPSPVTPLSPIEGENSHEQVLIINEAGQAEWVALPNDDGSSYIDEDNIGQKSSLTPLGEHEPNEQMVEELTLDDIFGGADNHRLASVEACQSSKMVSNECCVDVEEDVWDFSVMNDLIEFSSLVSGKKIEEGDSCSQDAYLYDSSSFDLGNKDGGIIFAFNVDEYHEAPDNDETQGATVGGNLVVRTISHPERLMLSSTPANIDLTNTPGPHSVAQTSPKTTEIASNESVRKRKWFEVSGDREEDYFTRNARMDGSCGKENEDDGVSLHSGSHQNNAYPDELQGVESETS